MSKNALYLHEELMLLALRDDKGTVAGGTMYQQALGGALLAELVLRGRIDTEPKGKKHYAVVKDTAPIGEPVLDECLEKIVAAKRRATLQTWVTRFANVKRLKHRVAGGLADRGILREDESTVLVLFTRRVYPERDHGPERRIVERLEAAIRSESHDVAPRTAVLLALAHHSKLLRQALGKELLKERKKRIESIINGDVIGKATKEAIQAIQTAVMVAAVMPAVISSAQH